MVSGGVSLIMVMKFMGHTQWSTTLGYAHLESSDLDFCVDVLEKDKTETNVIDLTAQRAG